MSAARLEVDGSHGEGGGQILRSSLALSLVTQRPFVIDRIRANRQKPGLLRQHLTAVRAAAEIGAAEVEGAELGSTRIVFTPHGIHAGAHRFAIGTAGSTSLVLQAVLPGLLAASAPSSIVLEGGTHNSSAPPYEFLANSYLPLLGRMGARVTSRLERAGFLPRGGGRVRFDVEPGPLAALSLEEPGAPIASRAIATIAEVPRHVAERELAVLRARLGIRDVAIEERHGEGPGNVCRVELEREHVTLVFTGFGQRGVAAEVVAGRVADEVERWRGADVAVDEHLADQLLLPMALGQGGAFTTLTPTLHTRTHAEVIALFLDRVTTFEEQGPDRVRVTMR